MTGHHTEGDKKKKHFITPADGDTSELFSISCDIANTALKPQRCLDGNMIVEQLLKMIAVKSNNCDQMIMQ